MADFEVWLRSTRRHIQRRTKAGNPALMHICASGPAIKILGQIFMSDANLFVNPACSPWLRNMLVASFNEEWKAD
jgi:hypothetical protein